MFLHVSVILFAGEACGESMGDVCTGDVHVWWGGPACMVGGMHEECKWAVRILLECFLVIK